MAGSTPEKSRRLLLGRMLSRGPVLAGDDHRVLRDLQRRRHVQAVPLQNPRGVMLKAKAWEITGSGRAWLERRPERAKPRQIDIEESIAAASSGRPPEEPPLTDPRSPTAVTAGGASPQPETSLA